MWWLHCGPQKSVSDPPEGGQSPVWARWWLVWISRALFTHYRPHRQDTVKAAYVHHVCLNYRQTTTGQLLSSHMRDEKQNSDRSGSVMYKCVYILNFNMVIPACATTKACNWDCLWARGLQLCWGDRGTDVVNVSMILSACSLCLVLPSCFLSPVFIETSLQEKKIWSRPERVNWPSCINASCLRLISWFYGCFFFYCSLSNSILNSLK